MQLIARGLVLTIVYKKLISPNKKAFFLLNCDIMRNLYPQSLKMLCLGEKNMSLHRAFSRIKGILQTLNIDLIIPMYH